MSKPRQALLSTWPLAALLLLHTLVQLAHLRLDFWNDELYTIQHFVFLPVDKIVADYHVPNNHILFSLLAHGWAKLAGINSVQAAISNIVWLRLLPFFCSCLCLCFVFLAARKIATGWVAPLAVLLLETSIPFFNFAAQMRGYSLSMCLAAALGYTVVLAFEKEGWARLLSIFLLSIGCVYTLPTNVFFLVASALAILGLALLSRKKNAASLRMLRAWTIVWTMATGGIVGAALYLPLLPQMQTWQAAATKALPALGNTRAALPVVAYHFLSARYLILLPALRFIWTGKHLRLPWLWAMTLLLVLPFLLADIRTGAAPHRVFLTSLPWLCFGLAWAINRGITDWPNERLRGIKIIVWCLYCLVVFGFQVRRTNAIALRDIQQGIRRLDLYYQYNLHDFYPQADAQEYATRYARPETPVFDAATTENDLAKYLVLGGTPVMNSDSLSLDAALRQYDTLDVMTELPSRLHDSLRQAVLLWDFRPLLPGIHRIQIVRLSKRKL
ncbi:MAG: hypothetical protein JST06_11585 [Bacteroidetes bacterium]|nr:hypothetical protein [Bacteroidota bacterium]MBS1629630.1 hypothetical protein [Bacteroidota bacterium]